MSLGCFTSQELSHEPGLYHKPGLSHEIGTVPHARAILQAGNGDMPLGPDKQ